MTILGTPCLSPPLACLQLGPPGGAVLFSKSHHPWAPTCVRKTKIKSPRCDFIYILVASIWRRRSPRAARLGFALGLMVGRRAWGLLFKDPERPKQRGSKGDDDKHNRRGRCTVTCRMRRTNEEEEAFFYFVWLIKLCVLQHLGGQSSGSGCTFEHRLQSNRS